MTSAILILRNGQRITVKGISLEYIETLMGFKILAGYIVRDDSCDVVRWP